MTHCRARQRSAAALQPAYLKLRMTVTDGLIEWNHRYHTYMRCSIEVTTARRAGVGTGRRAREIAERVLASARERSLSTTTRTISRWLRNARTSVRDDLMTERLRY